MFKDLYKACVTDVKLPTNAELAAKHAIPHYDVLDLAVAENIPCSNIVIIK